MGEAIYLKKRLTLRPSERLYNDRWLIERLAYRTPSQVTKRRLQTCGAGSMITPNKVSNKPRALHFGLKSGMT